MIRRISTFVAVTVFLFALVANGELRNDSFNTLPDSNKATYRADSQTFFAHENAQREGRYLTNFVFSGGLHGTSPSLTSGTFSTEAFVPERISQTAVAITYDALASDVCWTIISSANAAITGWNRVGSTVAYYYKCQGTSTPVQPQLPANSAWLMQVTIAGSAITAVDNIQKKGNFSSCYDVESYANFASAITDIGATVGSLCISSRQVISTSVVVPGTLAIIMRPGGIFSVNSGITITIRGFFSCPDNQKCFTGDALTPVLFDSGTGSIPSPIPHVSVLWFGAIADGVSRAINTTATNAAINSLPTSVGGKVFFPAGSYSFLTPPQLKAGITISGVPAPGGSQYLTTLTHDAAGTPTALFDLRGWLNTTVEYMLIRHATGTQPNTLGIWMGKEYQVVRYVLIQNFLGSGSVGLRMTGSVTNEASWAHLEHVRADGNTIGIIIEGPSYNNNNHFYNIQTTNNRSDGIRLDQANAVNIHGMDSENNALDGTGYNLNIMSGHNIYVFGGWLEGVTKGAAKGPIFFPVGSTSNFNIYYYGYQDSEPTNFYEEKSRSYFMSMPRQVTNDEAGRFSAIQVTNVTPRLVSAISLGTILNNGSTALNMGGGVALFGYLFLHTTGSTQGQCIFYLGGADNTVKKMVDPAALCTASQPANAGTTNVYYSNGYVLENKTGGPLTYSGTLLGP